MTLSPKRILAAVAVEPEADRELARAATDVAVDLALRFESELLLVHAPPLSAPGSSVGFDFSGAVYEAMAAVLKARIEQANKALAELSESATASGVRVETRLALEGASVPERILAIAEEEAADLIVLCSHGRRGIKRVLLGSVAERVAHLSPVPVLILKAAQEG